MLRLFCIQSAWEDEMNWIMTLTLIWSNENDRSLDRDVKILLMFSGVGMYKMFSAKCITWWWEELWFWNPSTPYVEFLIQNKTCILSATYVCFWEKMVENK